MSSRSRDRGTHVEAEKDVDLDTDVKFDYDADIDVDKDVKVDVQVNSDADIKDNVATMEGDVTAFGDNTLAELTFSVTTDDDFSEVSVVAIAATD